MKKVLKLISVLLALIAVSCSRQEEPAVTEVSLTRLVVAPKVLELQEGETYVLTLTYAPKDADVKFEWESSNYEVAGVYDGGEVVALAPGMAKIKVKGGGRSASCSVTVVPAEEPEKPDPDNPDPDNPDPDNPDPENPDPDNPDPENPDPENPDPEDDTPTGTKGVGEFPSVWIELSAGSVDRNNYTTTKMSFRDPDSWYTSVKELNLDVNIRGRGHMSWGLSKKPYRLKFQKEEGHRVFGMNKNRDWDLIANHNDHILLRNSIGYHISRKMGFDWTPKVRPVEVYMNNKYQGNYILVQHKEVASEKVNIVPATPDTAPEEGGYYLEVEDASGNGDYTSAIYKMPFFWSDPEEPTEAQKKYLKGIIDTIEEGLSDGDFKKVWDNLEMSTMVDYFILKELAKDIDGCLRKSNYFSKAPGTKLRMCHVWDFDLGFGNCTDLLYDGHEYSGSPEGWFIKEVGGNYYLSGNYYGRGKGWYPAMFKDPDFVAAVKARWTEVYPILADVPAWVDEQVGYYRKGYDHNFEKWNIRENIINRTIEGSYDGEISAFKSWYQARLQWMNTEISKW